VSAPPARPVTPVAVGVLVRGDGAVLLADRPAGKPYAGHWEFPGGKIEPGERVEEALQRELREELDLHTGASTPWVVMDYDYPHAYVRLHFRRIFQWRGVPRPLEGQQLRFHLPGAVPPAPLLPAALPALRWVGLPSAMVRSPGDLASAGAAAAWLEAALGRGLQQAIWYEPALDGAAGALALRQALGLAQAYGARLLVDVRCAALPAAAAADVFLDLDSLRAAAARPADGWVGAAVATRADLARAARLGCDFAVLQDLAATAAAPRWDDNPLPCYLAGELGLARLEEARRAGFHGLAAPRLP
jgi:8-oxo-dGTP diphosphatase